MPLVRRIFTFTCHDERAKSGTHRRIVLSASVRGGAMARKMASTATSPSSRSTLT